MSGLIKFQLPGEHLGLDFLDHKAGVTAGTFRSIFNAWVAASVIDERGAVWVKASRLHTILRTNKANARYIVGQAPKRDIVEINSFTWARKTKAYETLIRSTKVCEWVDIAIQSPAAPTKANYLRYSEAVYRKVRDCPIVKNIRAEFGDRLDAARRSLKQKRVRRLKLKHDELTGQALERGAEFAHIRSASIYFELADRMWNGLVVNAAVHRMITAANVLDEASLLEYCGKQKWKTDWNTPFMLELQAYELTGQAA